MASEQISGAEYERRINVTLASFANSPDGRWVLEETRKQRIDDVLAAKEPIAMARAIGALGVVEYFISFGGDL